MLLRVHGVADLKRVVNHPQHGRAPKLILGGGSNLVLTRDVTALVLKIEIMGRRLVDETDSAPGSSRPAPARAGTTSSTGRWSRAGRGSRTWR